MKAVWEIEFKTGADLSDNDRWRIRELVSDAVRPIAEEYLADYDVQPRHFLPGPNNYQDRQGAWERP
jgi:hypothetical protein